MYVKPLSGSGMGKCVLKELIALHSDLTHFFNDRIQFVVYNLHSIRLVT